MTHIHIPDGILPVWLWVSGFLLMSVFLALSLYRLRTTDMKKKVPLLGALSAVMLVVMSLEILPIAYHLNMSVAAGILLGPSLGFMAAFIVNLMLAFVGHGGITVVGLNTLLLGAEALLGHTIFHLLRKGLSIFWSAALSTVLSLFLATLLLIGIVGVSHVRADFFGHHYEHAGGVTDQTHVNDDGQERSSLRAFAVIVLSLGSIGWIIEGAITGAVIQFISRVKPDLLGHGLHKTQQ
ncbi:MAG TPA: energy-coupling factor ABC transporter permease [Nitrospirota bacterium]|nr:energy-coupling factor ABC transporter permease [Nitrospirota bacterium]